MRRRDREGKSEVDHEIFVFLGMSVYVCVFVLGNVFVFASMFVYRETKNDIETNSKITVTKDGQQH